MADYIVELTDSVFRETPLAEADFDDDRRLAFDSKADAEEWVTEQNRNHASMGQLTLHTAHPADTSAATPTWCSGRDCVCGAYCTNPRDLGRPSRYSTRRRRGLRHRESRPDTSRQRFAIWHAHSPTTGERLLGQGAVVESARRGETIRAAVEGSQYKPDQVRIELNETGVVDTACSCPYDHGGICKHRVAVLRIVRVPTNRPRRPMPNWSPTRTPTSSVTFSSTSSRVIRGWRARQSRLETLEPGDEGDDARERTRPRPGVDPPAVQYILRPTEGRSAHAYDPYEAVETDVETLRDCSIRHGQPSRPETARRPDILEPLDEERDERRRDGFDDECRENW